MSEGPEIQASTSSLDQSSSSQESLNKQTQIPSFSGLKLQNGNLPAFPILYPALVPALFPPQQDQEQMNHGPGLYAVPVLPFTQPIVGFPSNNLIPFTYNLPTERSLPETRELGGEQGQTGEQPQQQQQAGLQRQVVVRRFQIAIQLDLLLILKLAAVIFLFNQDGSRQRLTLLVFFASLVYLYQTGALAPVIRWLSRGMHRAALPPQPPRPAGRPDNIPPAVGEENENANFAEGQPQGENMNQHVIDGNRAIEHEGAVEPEQGEVGNRWWGIVRELQMIVFGFITSLLPGFHNID